MKVEGGGHYLRAVNDGVRTVSTGNVLKTEVFFIFKLES